MTKAELIAAIAAKAGTTNAATGKVLDALAEVVTAELKAGNEPVIPGIGKLHVTERAAREGRNPRTGEPVQIEASKSVKLKVAKSLKDAL